MAKEKAMDVASLNPDEMLQGGLRDDFRGKVIEAAYCRWDYDGTIEDSTLAARLTIQPKDDDGDDDGDPFVQHWSAGSLDSFVPSQDGKTPADEDEAGPYALRVGKKAQLNNNTNYAHLMRSAIESGEAAKGKPFTRENLTASIECLVGLDAHWDRVPQAKRSGLVEDGDGKRVRDVLTVTDVFGYGDSKPAKGAKAAVKGALAKPALKNKRTAVEEEVEEETEEQEGEVTQDDSDLRDLVVTAISEAGDDGIKKGKLVGAIVKLAGKDPRKAKFIKRCTEADFIEADGTAWTYDEESGILTL